MTHCDESDQNRCRGQFPRRSLLRATGAAVGVPFLDLMRPANGGPARSGSGAESPLRMLAVHLESGLVPQFFYPAAGADPLSSPYLQLLADHHDRLTVISGMSHPNLGAGHEVTNCFLTGAPNPSSKTFRNTQSIDQFAADRLGHHTRFPSLVLSVQNSGPLTDILSVSHSGSPIPAETSPRRLYRAMFVAGTSDEKAATVRRIDAGGSVLDLVLDKATRLTRDARGKDRERLDQYFESVRDLEKRLVRAREWEHRDKPRAIASEPVDIDDRSEIFERMRLMFDMMRLALQTDSTRFITCYISTFHVVPKVDGVSVETHSLTHHGNEPEKLSQLRRIEESQVRAFDHLLSGLRGVEEAGGTLLDNTMVLFGSGLGNANSHSSTNLPLVLAGGGFQHRRHLAFDKVDNEPMCNLFVTMLQRLGLEVDAFSSSTGTLRGLEA